MQDRSRGHRTGRVVIVEPHDDSRAMYAAYFESVGFKVSPVRTAAGALRVLSREAPAFLTDDFRRPRLLTAAGT